MMRTVGLITEYNPFHNGHLHHLQQSLAESNAEASVAVMSGHFLQRGEPAMLDKWCRTEMALAAGVDVVFELPLPWACNSAPVFAEGGVAALAAVGVDALCFGSESGVLSPLAQSAALIECHRDQIEVETKKRLRRGENYPHARAAVVAGLSDDPEIASLLQQPNNILGIEYLRALERLQVSIEPFTVARIGAGYHDIEAVAGIASATGIRNMVKQRQPVDAYLPPVSATLLKEWNSAGLLPDEEMLFRLLVQQLQQRPEWLRSFYQVDGGVENRLYKAAQTAAGIDGLIDAVKSKHLTRTRVQRILTYILLGMDAGTMSEFLDCGPLYLHLLGQTRHGEALLASRRKETELPLVGNYSRIRSILTHHYGKGSEKLRLAQEMLAWEIRATRTYTLLLKNWSGENRNLDFFRDVIRAGCPD